MLAGPGYEGITATFKNTQTEGKIELEFAAFATPIGALTSIVGAQGAYQQLDTAGQAILLPAQTRTAAAYFLNEVRHTDTLRTQLAGRIEGVDIAGTAFTFPPNFLPPPNEPGRAAAKLDFMPKSVSFGIIKDLPSYLVASLTLQRIERAPRALELFAQGPDGSEKTFKIGNPNLGIETAQTAEIGLKRIGRRFQVRRQCLLHVVRQVHLLARHRHPVPGNVCHLRRRHRLHPGQLRSARRDVSRRRAGLAMGRRTARERHVRCRWTIRCRARDVHRRQQCSAHPADAARRRRLLAERQLVCPCRPAARLRAERRFAVRYDDRRIRSAQGAGGEPAVLEGFAVGRGRGRDRTGWRQSAQRQHPQCRSIPQGRDPAARSGLQTLPQRQIRCRPAERSAGFVLRDGAGAGRQHVLQIAADARRGLELGGHLCRRQCRVCRRQGCYQRGIQRGCDRPAV